MDILLVGKSALKTHAPQHDHECWEIISNIEGEGFFDFNDTRVCFDENVIVCIPPHVMHEKSSKCGYRDLWLQFSDFPELDSTSPTILTDDSEHNISSLINILYSVQFHKSSNYIAVTESLLDSIKQLILSRMERKAIDPRIETIVQYIIHHFQNPEFDLDECLTIDGYCSDYMRRLFYAQMGQTPHEYLNNLRIKTAKKLLSSRKTSNYSVSEISDMVGFNDLSYFSRVFKKATGFPPGKYAKIYFNEHK